MPAFALDDANLKPARNGFTYVGLKVSPAYSIISFGGTQFAEISREPFPHC